MQEIIYLYIKMHNLNLNKRTAQIYHSLATLQMLM